MRTAHRDHDGADVARMLGDAATSWNGPSPRAAQSRWAAAALTAPRPRRNGRLAVIAFALAAFVLASVSVAVASGGAAPLTVRVSHVLSAPPDSQPAPAAPVPASVVTRPQPAASPRPSAQPTTATRPSPTTGGDDHRGRRSPRPSESPDD